MITSPENDKLKLIRKLHSRSGREKSGLFVAEGEDLIDAAERAEAEAEFVLQAGVDVEAELLDAVSTLGSGTRVIGVYPQRFSDPGGQLSVYLHGVGDPGNVGTAIRAAHALADGPVVVGPDCADPYSPKAVRASMGSVFARPPARAGFEQLEATTVALDTHAGTPLSELVLEPPLVVCVGAERDGLPPDLLDAARHRARIPIRVGGPDSLNAAMAATVALYEFANRIGDGG